MYNRGYNKKKKEKTRINFSKKIVLSCIVFIILYTILQLFFSYKLGIELSPTLTTCVYAFFGTELVSCAVIRIFDKDSDFHNKSNNDRSDG